MKPNKWTTKDGNILDISNMTTDHIKNCIRSLEKAINSYELELLDPSISSFKIGLTNRMVQLLNKKLSEFKEEYNKRG